jgi:hypothetical protein
MLSIIYEIATGKEPRSFAKAMRAYRKANRTRHAADG